MMRALVGVLSALPYAVCILTNILFARILARQRARDAETEEQFWRVADVCERTHRQLKQLLTERARLERAGLVPPLDPSFWLPPEPGVAKARAEKCDAVATEVDAMIERAVGAAKQAAP